MNSDDEFEYYDGNSFGKLKGPNGPLDSVSEGRRVAAEVKKEFGVSLCGQCMGPMPKHYPDCPTLLQKE